MININTSTFSMWTYSDNPLEFRVIIYKPILANRLNKLLDYPYPKSSIKAGDEAIQTLSESQIDLLRAVLPKAISLPTFNKTSKYE